MTVVFLVAFLGAGPGLADEPQIVEPAIEPLPVRIAVLARPEKKGDAQAAFELTRLVESAIVSAGAVRTRFEAAADAELLPVAMLAVSDARKALLIDTNWTRPAEHEAAWGAVLLALKRATAAASSALFAEAWQVLAMTRLLQDDPRLARSYLEMAVALRPGLTERDLFGLAKLKPLLAEIQASRSTGITGQLRVDSTPPGADVLVADEVRGVTPVTLTLPAGLALVKVRRDGSTTMGALIDVPAGKTEARTFKLAPLPGAAHALAQAVGLSAPKKALAGTAQTAAFDTLARHYDAEVVVAVRVSLQKKGKARAYRIAGTIRGRNGAARPVAAVLPLDATILTSVNTLVSGWLAN